MRTTVTIDDSLARRLKDEMRARGTSFRQTLENTLKRGLDKENVPSASKSFCVRAKRMGLKAGIDPVRLHDLDTDLEVDRFLSVTQRQKEKR